MENVKKQIISEEYIYKILKITNQNISKTAIKWKFFNYIKKNSLVRVGEKKYVKRGEIYSYTYQSQLTKDIDNFLYNLYPALKIVIWENKQLNEWLNLLLSTNIIYIEVEKEFVDYVFFAINDKFKKHHLVLLNPSNDTISTYLREDLIIVKTLYSKAPVSHYDRKIRLEKLAVDTYCGKMQLDTRGKIDVISGIKDNYDIDVDKMMAYASRRRVKDKFMQFLEEI